MKRFAIALVCVLAASAAMAGSQNAPQPLPALANASIKSMPPLDKVLARGVRNGHRVSTSVTVAYDQQGKVLSVKLNKPTGDRSLDKAILDWAAMVKIQADGAGSGIIPVKVNFGG